MSTTTNTTTITTTALPLLLLLLFLTAPHFTSAVDVTSNPSLIARLITSATQLDRLSLLPNDSQDWHFDFTNSPNYNFAPGGVVNMNAATFPAAKGNGMTCKLILPFPGSFGDPRPTLPSPPSHTH
jgi:hypothetical protein